MKMFAFGAVVGALICFALLRVTAPPVMQTAAPAQLPAGSVGPVSIEPEQRESCPNVRPVSRVEPTKALEKTATSVRADSQASSSGPAVVKQRCISIENLSEEDTRALATRAYQLQEQRERTKKESEPKDASWAYSTEMLIRQHIESHLSADRYKTLKIDCRTTFCELQMTGTGAEARDIADRLAKEIVRQPWSDIAQKGGGGGSNGDDWHIEVEWYRPRTDSERKLWFGMRDQR
jgi:hypothetical protein